MAKRIVAWLIGGLWALSGVAILEAQEARVDWVAGKIVVTGIGAPNPQHPIAAQRAGALRVARLDAGRKLLEQVKGMPIDSETLVENFVLTSDVIRSKIQDTIKDFREVKTRYMSDGSVELDVEYMMGPEFRQAIFAPPDTAVKPPVQFAAVSAKPVEIPEEAPADPELKRFGLVVDAKGLGVQPALAPKLLDEQGNEVYGPKLVDRKFAIERGVAGYRKTLDQARGDEMMKEPLVIKGLKAGGARKTDVVLSKADGEKIKGHPNAAAFLNQAAVIIVID